MQTFSESPNNAAATLQAGQALATAQQNPQQIAEGGTPFIVTADGGVTILDHLLPAPLRHKASVALDDAASFIDYVQRFKQPGTLIFVKTDLTGGKFTAKLDHPKPGETAWEKHVATLALLPTPDWKEWIAIHGRWQTQQAFCEFVEKQRHVFATPSAADMLEISRSIEAKTDGNFKSGIRLPNGDRSLIWETTTTATAGNAKLEIPEEITINIVPFEGGEIASVCAFLRYRIASGAVSFQIEIQRPEEIVRGAVAATREKIAAATELPVLAGSVAA